MSTRTESQSYLPAAGVDFLLPFYDAITKWMGADRARLRILDHADLHDGHQVLDVGCGTGTLAVQIKQLYPDAYVVGLDPDARALRRARRKSDSAGVSVQFDQAFSNALPYAAQTFDRVFSSFMFHHLEPETRQSTLREMLRVLKPGGRLLLLDFGGPKEGGPLTRLFHVHARLADNDSDRVMQLMTEAGFRDVEVVATEKVMRGLSRATYYRAIVPSA